MNELFAYLKRPVVYHTIFWVLYFTMNVLRWGSYFDDYVYSVKSNLVEFPLHVVLCYFVLYYLMPRLIHKQVGLFFLLVLISTFIIVMIRIILTYELVTTEVYKESIWDEELFGRNYIVAAYIGELYVLGVVSSIKLTKDWVQEKNSTNQLEKEKLEIELAFLRSQVQPHFFFNTLNNLYSLSLDKSDKAPETILKLSDLMSYVVYETKKNSVSLAKDITHIQNYVELEKLRFGDKVAVDFKVEGNIKGLEVAPVLLIPFIENSFKHGLSNILEQSPINISLKVDNHRLFMKIENPAETKMIKSSVAKKENKGVGLKNTKRRLEILYADDYELSLKEEGDKYITELNIPVN